MDEAQFSVSIPENETVFEYEPGSARRESLITRLQEMSSQQIEIPLIVGGKEIATGNTGKSVMPHDHGHVAQ